MKKVILLFLILLVLIMVIIGGIMAIQDLRENQSPEERKESGYPWHEKVWATEFFIGEEPSSDNGYISNAHSAWDERWVEHYGGIDDPKNRNSYLPSGFVPKENPFYCALPYGDFDDTGIKNNIHKIYWYQPDDEKKEDFSIIKNRWIKVRFNGQTCYCQWEDVGPNYSDDWPYVFGSSRPENEVGGTESRSGLDLSPAMRTCLGMDGHDQVDWQFVDSEDVPDGPWKEIVTKSGTCWVYEGSSCQ